MKTYQIPFVLLFLVFSVNVSGLSVLEQLKNVNSYWNYHLEVDKTLKEKRVLTSDREIIQLHLQLVEKTLREIQRAGLNEEQKRNRLRMLDVLHDYWVAGVFPKNTGHTYRIPYFIDVYGTACAVGQLIISSNHEDVAKQISRENNNGYISDLVLKYPQIENWANKHGFAIEELAWIQPCYNPPLDTFGLKNPTCHSAMNGYFCPDFSQLQGPLTKSFYHWKDNTWTTWTNFCGHWAFDHLQVGKYKWEVKDGLNTVHTFSTQLTAPAPATITTIQSGDFNSCNGVITVSVQGGVLPFKYYWAGHTGTTSVLSSVCEESITLTFWEAGNSCPQFIQIQTSPVGLSENNINTLQILPNPVADVLQLRFDPAVKPEYEIAKIFNVHGQLILRADLRSGSIDINLSQLPPGFYFLQVDNYKMQRIVKE